MKQEELDNRLGEIEASLMRIERTASNRTYLLCESQNVYEICRFLFENLALRFVISTGVDAEDCFEVLHHFANDESGCIVTVKAFIRDRSRAAFQ